ncbi:hydroquinone glucosyltransferase-like [Papaver somniferum]|uniref:hydroquinone glucosyltransferase-like n=1 Tax=Papaver somniferum TaxID=3469 RepID=UPI000E6FDCAA|nr:hydroquinone glucosyltransferase-like [Papaver somniferum]
MSPCQAVYSTTPPTISRFLPGSTTVHDVDILLRARDRTLKILKFHIQAAQTRMKTCADAHRTERSFNIHNWVFLCLQTYKQSSAVAQPFNKLSPKYYGPFRVIERIGEVAYKLQFPVEIRSHLVFHVSQLKLKLGFSVNVETILPTIIDYHKWEPANALDRRCLRKEIRLVLNETSSPVEATKLSLDSLPRAINTIFLVPVDLSDLSDDTEIGAIGIADEFHINSYIFISSTAMLLSSIYNAPKLDQAYSCEYRDVPGLIQILGCVPIRGVDLMNPFEDRKTEAYASFLQYWKKLNLGKGIFINSFEENEHDAIEVLNGKQWDNPPVYAIGPLTRTGVCGYDESGYLKWLDNQPPESVLFVSFGSGGTLSGEQLTELAIGLEMSEQKFLWFLKSPAPRDMAASTSYLSTQSVEDPYEVLPKGFLERTRNLGLVVSSWAPQVEILSHKSNGGFLSHCGWNSTLESILQGVPLIAWPLFAEQTMNAVMLTENMKVALRPTPMENGITGRDEICKVVKELMEGEEGMKLKSKMGELRSAASRTLSEGGSSFKTFAEVVNA